MFVVVGVIVVGDILDAAVGVILGIVVGDIVDGIVVGVSEGVAVGDLVGILEGCIVEGAALGVILGIIVGVRVLEGRMVGVLLGVPEGTVTIPLILRTLWLEKSAIYRLPLLSYASSDGKLTLPDAAITLSVFPHDEPPVIVVMTPVDETYLIAQ